MAMSETIHMTGIPPRISLGPVLYYWERETLLDFYQRIADTPVDIVYLGETVCSKRRSLRNDDWLELADSLEKRGKEVVLSTLTLIEAGSELGALRRLCTNPGFTIEANDMGAVQLLAGKHPFTTGPAVNIYNHRALDTLARLGLKRWTLPLELSRSTLEDMLKHRPAGIETEVFVYGRLPLAYSARCFTARANNLPKDDCQLRCLDHPDGLLLTTREQEDFLVLNGIQTQSAKTCNLVGDLGELVRLGVDVLRISPQSQHTEKIIETFQACLQGHLTPNDAETALQALMPTGQCNGYWHAKAGMDSCKIEEATCLR
jgi:collagenase-like PrtC family protease